MENRPLNGGLVSKFCKFLVKNIFLNLGEGVKTPHF